MLRYSVSIAVIVLALAQPMHAADLHGVALVIGESDYDSPALRDLDNPRNDARAMDDLLGTLGFDVDRVLDRGGDRLRSEIDDFVDEARGADVALVYYSGHGIEAGGEDYLVPTDADLSTPATAGQSLVPLRDLLDRLAKTVPVTIVLLDACRTNAFPAGTTIELPGSGQTIAVATTGLGELRGPVPVARPGASPDSLGVVIGFAAAPGQPALDGDKGGNSPYAAALLKHLGAAGYSFGDVMTLVSEEVYLKTDAQQLPWTNSSLRRVLSFGAPAAATDADEAMIADGRRRLLLSIAALPDADRKQVETLAQGEQVPLDQLYGMLQLLHVDTSLGSEDIDRQLSAGAQQLREILAQAPEAMIDDAEIARYTKLADEALSEGAIAEAQQFRAKASARAKQLETEHRTSDARGYLATAATYAKDADTSLLAFDYPHAAEMYRQAFETADYWDHKAGLTYKWSEARALYAQGDEKGDNDALKASISVFNEALAMVSPNDQHDDWARVQDDLGNALAILGEREGNSDTVEAAISVFHTLLQNLSREREPQRWADAQDSLGAALAFRGQREQGNESLEAAVVAFRAALEQRSREDALIDWAQTQNNLGNVLETLGEREDGTEHLEAAVVAFRAALEEETRERTPLMWAEVQINLGGTLEMLGERQAGTESLEAAAVALHSALEELPRGRVPLLWAAAQQNLGNALQALGIRQQDKDRLGAAAAAYRAALEERTRERTPFDWAQTQKNLGDTLMLLGVMGTGTQDFEAAVAAYRAALEVQTREHDPLLWALLQNILGWTEAMLADRSGNIAMIMDGRASVEAAWAEYKRAGYNVDGTFKERLARIDFTLNQMLAAR